MDSAALSAGCPTFSDDLFVEHSIMKYSSAKSSKKAFLLSLAAGLLLGAPVTFAAEVSNNDGGIATGSFRAVVDTAPDGETISFAQNITLIRPTGTAQSNAGILIFNGNGQTNFDNSLSTLFDRYLDEPLTFSLNDYFTKDIDKIDAYNWSRYAENLSSALDGLTRPTPVLNGSALTSGSSILALTSRDGTHQLRALVLQNAAWTVEGSNIDDSGTTADDLSIQSIVIAHGGAVALSSTGILESDWFSGNAIEAAGGDVKGGTGTNSVNTLTDANAYGGAVFAPNGKTSHTVFRQNAVTAWGGTAEGGSVTGPGALSMETASEATASGGAVYFSGSGTTNAFSDSVFQGNQAVAVGGSVSGGTSVTQVDSQSTVGTSASGGAISFGSGTVSSSIFQGNSVSATQGLITGAVISSGNSVDASSSLSGSALGGAVAGIDTVESSTVTGSVFQGNSVSLQGGSAVGSTVENTRFGYASIYADGDAYGGAVALRFGTVTESVFEANNVTIVGGTATGGTLRAEDGGSVSTQFNVFGVGGAVMMSGGTVSKSFFVGNNVDVTGATVQGGNAAQTGTGTFFGDLYGYASTEASGGAVGFYSYYSGTISDSVFLENTVAVKGGSAVAATFTGNDRTELDAQAAAFALGKGGAVSFDATGSITGSFLSGNSVTAVGGSRAESTSVDAGSLGWANADAYAFGGAVYIGGQTGSITDSTLTYNSVTATAEGDVVQGDNDPRKAEAYALGGAVFVNVEGTSAVQFGLNATDGKKTLIAHNTANGVASGIHFGSAGQNTGTGYVRDETHGAVFTVNTNKTGQVHLLDPVTVDLYSDTAGQAAFTMDVIGTGTFVWGGTNVLDANGGSTVNLQSGTVTLASDFSLGATTGIDYRTGSYMDAYATASTTAPGTNLNDLTVTVASAVKLNIDITRSPDLPAFDFTDASNNAEDGIFKIENGTVLSVETVNTRQLLDREARYLFASGLSAVDTDAALLALVRGDSIEEITAHDGKIYVTANYVSPYTARLQENRNSYRASDALNKLVTDPNLISDEQFKAITSNFRAVTPEYALSQMHYAVRVIGSVADTAQFDYFDRYEVLRNHHDAVYGVRGASPRCRPYRLFNRLSRLRLWGGYIGDFSHMDRHNGYESYKMSMDGILVGGDGKLDRCTTVGFYAAFLDETTHFRSINSGAYADGLQIGLLARRHLSRGWTLTGDLGYLWSDTDGFRAVGPFVTRSEFDQNAFTFGFGTERDYLCGPWRFKPFLRSRYVYAHQSGATEYGDTGTEARVSSFSGNSFTTNLGLEFARRFSLKCLIFAPRLSLSWLHEFGNKHFDTHGFYTALGPANAFRLSSAHLDRDRFVLGTDMRTSFCGPCGRPWSLVMAYDYIVSSHTDSHTVTFGLETRF